MPPGFRKGCFYRESRVFLDELREMAVLPSRPSATEKVHGVCDDTVAYNPDGGYPDNCFSDAINTIEVSSREV